MHEVKCFKLMKDVKLYKTQFEDFMYDIFNDHRLDRLSMEIDGILFRIKYMTSHNKDLSSIPELKDKFNEKSIEMRQTFSVFINRLLIDIITIPEEFENENIEDNIISDVKIDPNYVSFKLVLVSKSKEYLKYVDTKIPDHNVFNIFPDKYFRFYTDSYNDGIAKAYPELFEKKEQDVIGTGDDKDIFVHSFTFQTSERCSLNCTYCFNGDAKILMADNSMKKIKDIQIGDKILSVNENIINDENADDNEWFYNEDRIEITKVTNIITHEADTIEYYFGNEGTSDPTRITADHPCLTSNRKYEKFIDIANQNNTDGAFVMYNPDWGVDNIFDYEIKLSGKTFHETVYNLETENHTFIADMLIVHNCYQFNKTEMRMSFEMAKEFIDHLLNDDYGYINRYNSPAIIIEFIGGEPLLEIKLTRKIYEYFLERCYELNHPWFHLHRISICSNGLQYFDDEVQSFFKEYASQISFNISIDGNKELHDACRIQPNGEGSYDIDMMALNHFNKNYTPERNSKMTLAPSNISYLFDSVVDFIKNGMKVININCVFEEGWTPETALIEYQQLKKLADYLLDNDLENLYIAIFNERQEDMMDKYNDGMSCGGSGSMLSMRPNGQFYPCIRYMPTSVGNDVQDLSIGNVYDGLNERENNSEVLQLLDSLTRRGTTNDICFDCPISNDCMACTALGHTVFGTPAKRCSFICIQMQAEALANVYYWNLLSIKHPEYHLKLRKNMVPDEWALLVIDKDELEYLKQIETLAMITYMENE